LVCSGAGCVSSGCREVRDALVQGVMEFGLKEEIKVIETGCIGSCDLGPIVVVYPEGVFYQKVKPEDARRIAEEHLFKGRVVERLLYAEPATTKLIPTFKEIDFFKLQEKIVLRNCGLIDPMNIEEYIAREGYEGLAKALTQMSREEVVEGVFRSGLRGGEGPAFPRAPNGDSPSRRRAARNTWSATPMRETPGPSWTGAFWRATPTA